MRCHNGTERIFLNANIILLTKGQWSAYSTDLKQINYTECLIFEAQVCSKPHGAFIGRRMSLRPFLKRFLKRLILPVNTKSHIEKNQVCCWLYIVKKSISSYQVHLI